MDSDDRDLTLTVPVIQGGDNTVPLKIQAPYHDTEWTSDHSDWHKQWDHNPKYYGPDELVVIAALKTALELWRSFTSFIR